MTGASRTQVRLDASSEFAHERFFRRGESELLAIAHAKQCPMLPLGGSMLEAKAPFDTWPVHFVDERSKLLAWYVEPCTFIVQFLNERYDLQTAQSLIRLIDGARLACDAAIRANGGYTTLSDLRYVRSVDKDAQDALATAWKTVSPKDLNAAYLVPPENVSVYQRVAVHALNIVSAFRTGKVMNYLPTVEDALTKCNITRAPPPAKFPGS